MAERDFDKERAKKKGHTFILGGKTFHTLASMPVSRYVDPEEEDKDKDIAPLYRTINLINDLLVPEQRPDFQKLIRKADSGIGAQDLLDVSQWLIEVISGRPTQSPGSSGNGAGRTSSGSKAAPSKQGGSGKK